MKKLYLFFIFLLILFPCVFAEVPPYQSLNIEDQYLGSDLQTSLYTNTFYSHGDYDGLDVWYNSSSGIGTVGIFRLFGQGKFCTTREFKLCVIPTDDNFEIQITSLSNIGVYNFSVRVYNYSLVCPSSPCTEPNISASSLQSFLVYTNSSQISDYSQYNSFLVTMLGPFLNLFPSKDSLSLTARFGITFLTMFFFTLLIYFFSFKATKSIHYFVHIIVLLLNVSLFFFFIAIGYIPLGVVIIIALLLIGLAFFRIKGGGGR